MASNYGLNFGFRRSDEVMRISEGRVRTPKTGAALMLGTCVELDPATPGYVRVGAADVEPRPGICGLLLQEEFDQSIYDPQLSDTFNQGVAKKGRLSVITNGAGVKVWFKNTAGQTRSDGRVIPAVTMFTLAGLAIGDRLGWNGTVWAETATPGAAFMEVTLLDAARNYIEATLLV